MKKGKDKTYSEGQVAVILEEIRDDFKIFGEAQSGLSEKVDNLSEKADGIDERLIRVENRLIRVEDDVIEIKHKLSAKVDREEFHKLEKRMFKLEKLVLTKLS